MAESSTWWLKTLLLLPSVAFVTVAFIAFILGDTRQGMLNLLFWLTLCVVFPSVLFCLVSLIGKGLGLIWPGVVRPFDIGGAMIALVWLAVSLYGIIYGWKKVEVEAVTISSPRIPKSFSGYRIVHLSDFHIGTYAASPSTVDHIVDEVNALRPDLIVFTGDLVNSSSDEIAPFMDALSRMHAPDGVLSVLGNHDYCLYREYTPPDSPARELSKVIDAEKRVGWRLLRNESVRLSRGGDTIAVAGVDNAGSRMFPDRSDLSKAVSGLDSGMFKILLSHDPSHWRREVLPATDIDLTLSGHTHAMQFRIGNWSPSEWTYKEWGGLYDDSGRMLYVSTGVGENIAFRFGAWPQIVLLELNSESQRN